MVDQSTREDEITLKEILYTLVNYWNELLRYWYLLPLFCIPTLTFQLYKHFTHKVEYSTKVKYIVEGGTNSGNILSGFLGQFGLGGSENGFGPRKIAEVLKSKSNIANVILDKSLNQELLGNEIIDKYDLVSKWSKNNEKWKDFKIENEIFSELDTLEQKAFVKLYGFIVGNDGNPNPLMQYSYDDETLIMTIKVKTTNPNLSKRLVNSVFGETKNFFEEKIFEEYIASNKLLKSKKDSLEAVIENTEYEIARFTSSNRGLIDQVESIPLKRLQRRLTISTLTLGEVLKSYEVSNYNLKSIKPYFFVLDKPIGPISPSASSIFMKVVLGTILGGILFFMFVSGRKLLQDILRS